MTTRSLFLLLLLAGCGVEDDDKQIIFEPYQNLQEESYDFRIVWDPNNDCRGCERLRAHMPQIKMGGVWFDLSDSKNLDLEDAKAIIDKQRGMEKTPVFEVVWTGSYPDEEA